MSTVTVYVSLVSSPNTLTYKKKPLPKYATMNDAKEAREHVYKSLPHDHHLVSIDKKKLLHLLLSVIGTQLIHTNWSSKPSFSLFKHTPI